jgi:type IV secretory pathway VirB9-like protein
MITRPKGCYSYTSMLASDGSENIETEILHLSPDQKWEAQKTGRYFVVKRIDGDQSLTLGEDAFNRLFALKADANIELE